MAGRALLLCVALAVVSPAASQPAATTYNDMFGAFSPDGKTIAFTSDRTGDPEIYVANLDGSDLRRLTDTPGRDAHPSWHPSDGSLLFQSPREDGHTRLFAMKADGSDQRALAATTGFCGVASYAPTGGRIAFQCSNSTKDFGTADAPWRIYLLEPGKSIPTAATDGPANDQVPAWSPDGRRLLFFSDRGGANQIYELDLASGTVRQRTDGPATHSSATYSPDGMAIAMMRADPGGKSDVHVLRSDGTLVRITDSGPQFGTPAWSPDARYLLIQLPTPDGWRLHLAPSDGSAKPQPIHFR